MMGFLRACGRFFEQKIGLHRLGVLLSVTIIAIAAVVLYRKLHNINVGKVLTAMATVEYRDVALSGLFVALGYFTLTFYDLFALRTIGRKDVPYRIAALAGFTSYSVGHNVGASVFTGGAVRYRIYSAWGLDAIEVAKLCFIAGLTFWLGNLTMLGFGFAYHPQAASAIDQLPLWVNRTLGILALCVLAAYIAWVWRTPRIIGRQNWKVQLPNGPLTLVQIVIGIVDLSCCALAMYMLVPNDPPIQFIDVAVIFITATLLGFASHSPGGLGVFDAAMLIALWEYDAEELLAGLLIFRLLYYILPFALALAVLGIRELILHFSERDRAGDR
jgi:glycosyltransferase 2 family protein